MEANDLAYLLEHKKPNLERLTVEQKQLASTMAMNVDSFQTVEDAAEVVGFMKGQQLHSVLRMFIPVHHVDRDFWMYSPHYPRMAAGQPYAYMAYFPDDGHMERNKDHQFTSPYGVPEKIYREFEIISLELNAQGFKKFSAWAVVNRMRWLNRVERGDVNYEVNNNWIASMARHFMARYPTLDRFFEVRSLKDAA